MRSRTLVPATANTSSDVAALSSGDRIVNASTDVAALAAGTALQSQVNTLNTALTVASEGSSLLQVADGSLAQIETILQRQQAIATQAQSGSLSTTQLGFLDQEFQSLTGEIDSLASTTNFNGVNLLNGSISGQAAVATNTATGTTTSIATAAAIVTFNVTSGAVASDGDSLTIDGLKVTLTTNAPGTSGASGKVSIGTTAAATAANLAAFLNASGSPQLADLSFTSTGGAVSADFTGGKLLGTLSITSSANFATAASVTAAAGTIGAAGGDGLGINRYSAIGTTSGTILANGGTGSTNYGGAINVNNLANNVAFIGSVPTITGNYDNNSGYATLSTTIGGITYATTSNNLVSATPQTLTFNGTDSTGASNGGSFTITIAGNAIASGAVTSQSTLNPYVSQINNALSGITIEQNRDITSVQNGGTVSVGSTQVANLTGLSANLNTSSFGTVNISSITVNAPTTGTTDATLTAVINGDTYKSISGIGNQIASNTVIALQDTSNPKNIFSIVTGNSTIPSSTTTAIDLSSQANATAVQNALSTAFGLSNANASLSFQVGSSSTTTIGVSIGSATSSTLFGGQALSVATTAGAITASNQLTSALNTVISIRANVGALEERFNYASAAISNASQNEGAAKSTLLDTDVSATSTSFATAQVQLQAGIAVLAQANQLQQNLLKLIA